MATRFPNGRILSALIALVVLASLGGCTSGFSSRKVTFDNVSDTPLNLTFFVNGASNDVTWNVDEFTTFVNDASYQLHRGETAKYSVPSTTIEGKTVDPIVHIRVEPVRPSWESIGTEYWLELLTNPPVSIVATGPEDRLTFSTRQGAVAEIPQQELQGRFDHRFVGVIEDPAE